MRYLYVTNIPNDFWLILISYLESWKSQKTEKKSSETATSIVHNNSKNDVLFWNTQTFCVNVSKQIEHSSFFRVVRLASDFLENGFNTRARLKNSPTLSSVSLSSNSCAFHFVWLSRIRVVVAGICVLNTKHERPVIKSEFNQWLACVVVNYIYVLCTAQRV